MIRAGAQSIGFTIALASLMACSEQLPSTQVDRQDTALNQTASVGPATWSPAENATGVPITTPIVIKFSGPIQIGSVEDFMIRVENEIGQVYSTKKVWNAAADEVTITRFVGGQTIGWDMATTHYVIVEPYVRDSNGENIWPFDYSFRTADIGQQGSGEFKIIDSQPSSGWITPGTWLDVKLSQPIYPAQPFCDTTTFQGAFSIFVVDFLNTNGNFSVPAQPAPMVCLMCSAANVCDRLRFRAPNGWPMPYFLLNMLVVRIKPNYALRSATTGAQLQNTYQIDKAIMIGGSQ